MEELLKKHRQEHKDLQARITQKKKNANKKTRKGVNDECATLEQELKARQAAEQAALDSTPGQDLQVLTDKDVAASGFEGTTADVEKGMHEASSSNAGTVAGAETTAIQPAKKRNRQKERMARRAAEQEEASTQAEIEALSQTDHRAREREIMDSQLTSRGLAEQEVRSDGHCLYAAMADQLKQNAIPSPSDEPDYKSVRRDAATYISQHPNDFSPFLEEPLDDYVVKIRDTAEWGGQLELSALSKIYGITINVLQGDGQVIKIEPENPTQKEAWLAYYRHSFGLGEHYNSLRKRKT